MLFRSRETFPNANITPVDYDPGASEANQTNRLKLLMTVAKDNLKMQEKEKQAIASENKTEQQEEIKNKKINNKKSYN